ncbi:nitroreductase family protein [Tritrichomonas foetus]|uniref:Nitroreductase family protein n=1 Tax=Tritrichomonas foetus TaxID=1144522 RepID=A0A1J4K6T5_9EUKA|nr:nitroreductase family protein [Tritrichomonas foetus]|eukprot:OHT06682.1 nitroreductase family protein [Tritrichomonas foetus]
MFEAIEQRRTCRSFDASRKIPREVLEKIANAGVVTPTGVDAQSFDLFVVSKQETLDKVAESALGHLPAPFTDRGYTKDQIFYHAPTVIFIVPARTDREDCVNYDLRIIADSICIAAQLNGVNSAIIGLASCAPSDELKQILGLPNEATAVGVALGYAAADWKPQPKDM